MMRVSGKAGHAGVAAIWTNQGRLHISDGVGFGIPDIQEIRTEKEEGDNLALQLGERLRRQLPARERVDPDEASRPCPALQRQPAAERLEFGVLDVPR
jgi:hypothetical protein